MNIFHLYGFNGFGDFIVTALGLKTIKLSFLGMVGAIIIQYFTNFFCESIETLLILYFLMGIDLITGSLKAVKAKKFTSRRFSRIWILVVFNSLLIFISWMLSNNNFLFTYIPAIVSGGLYTTYFISFVENAGELGYLPKSIQTIVKTRFGFRAFNEKIHNLDQTNNIDHG